MSSPIEELSASTFWDMYFGNRYVQLMRNNDKLQGECALEPSSGDSLFPERPLTNFYIARSDLKNHDYQADGRFTSIEEKPKSFAIALQKIADKSYS